MGLRPHPTHDVDPCAVDPEHRLHRPVACRLRLFHAQAGLLRDRVLDELTGQLDARLEEDAPQRGRVLPFRDGGA